MSSQNASCLSSLKDAQAFLHMDPNLLRFPEVVLERIQIKIEDDTAPDPAVFLSAGGEEPKPQKEPKAEEWLDYGQQKGGVSCYRRVGGAYRSRGGRLKKEHGAEFGRQGHRAGYNGLLGEMERSSALRRGGKKRRGGWHNFLFRERQQLQRKLKKQAVTYVEEERQRGLRFSEEENATLVAAVLDHYRELCGQCTMKGSATRKRRLWQEVTNRVNEVAPTYRTMEVCKKRYGDCRRTVRVKMAALEQQALGRGDLHEQIRFNHWEEQLRQKIVSVQSGGSQQVLDTCQAIALDVNGPNPAETPGPQMCTSWSPTVDTAACAVPQLPPGETLSEGEEATSPLDVQIVREWPEEEAARPPPPQAQPERMELPEPLQEAKVSPAEDGSQYVTIPEVAFMESHYQQIQEEHRKSLRHLSRAHTAELHKLRENMVDGNARMLQQLGSLASEVRELNSHVRQIHLNQAHFNLMFQNYLSDTKQFYGSMVQAIRNLQGAPSITPIPSPASSPPPNPLPQTPMTDYATLSPAGSAEPATASSTGSEVPAYIAKAAFHSHPPQGP